MSEHVKLLTPPGLADAEPLRGRLELWLNERYAAELGAAREKWLGKGVQFKNPKSSNVAARGNWGATAAHAGRTGKVTSLLICLDDDQLFRLAVTLDLGGGDVTFVSPEDVCHCDINLHGHSWALTTFAPDGRDVGRRVRVVEAGRHEGRNLFLKHGYVTQAFVSGGGVSEYAVRVDGEPRALNFKPDEVEFL